MQTVRRSLTSVDWCEKKEKWKVITYVSQEKCRVHILLFVVSYLSVNLWIIIVFVSFSTFSFQFCIINKWYWIDLTIFCWCLPCYSCSSSLHIPYFFSFTILFRLVWIELVDVRKEHFHSCEVFYLSLHRKRYVLKEMRNRNAFVVFLNKIIKYFVLY